MSSRLSEVLAEGFSGCAKMDAIWDELYPNVWLKLPSFIVAKAFLLVLYTCCLAMKTNGGNKRHKKGAMRCGIRDFYEIVQFGMVEKTQPRNTKKRTTVSLSREMLD